MKNIHKIDIISILRCFVLYSQRNKSNTTKSEPDEENLDDFLQQLKVDESFHGYLMKVLNQQLDSILNDINHLKTNPQTNLFVYDCESYTEKELFTFLSKIWT